MGEHIEFVESVYEKVKNPLSYICNKITGGGGESNNALPEPDHSA